MKAAIVTGPGRTPEYGDFDEPEAREGFELVRVAASALTTVTRARAAGTHYSADAAFPFVPGVDGVGTTGDGRRVLFLLPDAPFGGLGQVTRVGAGLVAPVPDGLDDALAAALVNPGMAPIAALVERAAFQEGETVLVQGATGVTGRLAVQIAKRLGARRVIALGRDPVALAGLRTLGADAVVPLQEDPVALQRALAPEFEDGGIDVVLDYLDGPPAEALLTALSALHRGRRSLRYVVTGGAAGVPRITLPSAPLASSRIDLLGSGIGSVAIPDLVRSAARALAMAAESGLEIDRTDVPLRDVGSAWTADHGRSRVVFTVG